MARETYVIRNGKAVLKQEAEPLQVHQIMPDIPDYRSPLGTGWVTSRSHRREELKRHNCVEVDPGSFKPKYINERFARKHGLPINQED